MPTYKITPQSVLEIHANSSVHPIEGKTHEITGEAAGEVKDGQISLDPQPTGWFEIPVDAMKSGHKLQDMEMRRRIEAKKFPTIRYELRRLEGGPESFKAMGTLTFHGVTKEFTEEVSARVQGKSLTVEGEHTMDIRDYGMKPPKILNLQVHPEIRVVLRVEAEEV